MRNALFVVLALAAVAFAQDSFKRERNGSPADATKNASEGKAPPPLKAEAWLNTPDGKPLTFEALKGKVVLIDFWAYW